MSCSKCVGVTPCPQRIPVCVVGELRGSMSLEKLDLVIMSENIKIRDDEVVSRSLSPALKSSHAFVCGPCFMRK